ncbi:MAG: FGGY family carbohydrate kinase [Anaerolineales bacterium]|nr:FGGY family carbohydrate kinase [Anaerolineales bacterium]
MNLLGIDVGTTGCKVALFTPQGEMLVSAYREYDAHRPQPGWAQLETPAIWENVQEAIRSVTAARPGMVIKALSVSSLGEAVVPVSADRRILGPSILNFDPRGEEYLPDLARILPDERLYAINGNTLGNHYSLTKLKWIQAHQPKQYASAYKFLHWGAFIAFMLGADPVVDYSLANRSLLFDIQKCTWSERLLEEVELDPQKLPATAPSGTVIGRVSAHIARGLGLTGEELIVSGAHDQCANAVGCGVVDSGSAVYGMGTYHCITHVFSVQQRPQVMIERGLNTEHHAIPDRYVCFIYNQGGSLVKWFRDTFAAAEHHQASQQGKSVYPALFAEIPEGPSSVMVLPHFSMTGPPAFISDSCGLVAGLRLETSRGEILKGIIEGAAYYLKEVVDSLPVTAIRSEDYRAVGGGSKSDAWVQTCADIFGQPFTRPAITEAGALGAAIIAGVGSGLFASFEEGVAAMVKLDRTFEPEPNRHQRYQDRYQRYRRLWPVMRNYLRDLSSDFNH